MCLDAEVYLSHAAIGNTPSNRTAISGIGDRGIRSDLLLAMSRSYKKAQEHGERQRKPKLRY